MKTSQPAPDLKGTQRKIAILPIGSCEQHGSYLPVDTDLRIAQMIAEKFSETFSPSEMLLLPIIPFSCSYEHQGLGTVSFHVSTLAAIIHDVAQSLKTWDTPFLLILVNWHGGNDTLATIATEISATESLPTAVIPSTAQVGQAWSESGMTTAKDVHAGAIESAIVQAYWPECLSESIPSSAHCEPAIFPAKTQPVLQALGSYAVTQQGIWGAPEEADPTLGRVLIDTLVTRMHEQAKALLVLVDEHLR